MSNLGRIQQEYHNGEKLKRHHARTSHTDLTQAFYRCFFLGFSLVTISLLSRPFFKSHSILHKMINAGVHGMLVSPQVSKLKRQP